jgi:hypothetical protein
VEARPARQRGSRRAIAHSLGLSSGTVGATVLRARAAGLTGSRCRRCRATPYRPGCTACRTWPEAIGRPLLDYVYLHAERRKAAVTLDLLHLYL